MAFAVWITGLPGSGKSTISRELKKGLAVEKVPIEHLRLDEFRKTIVPDPKFTDEERDFVYKKLVDMASDLVKSGKNVIIDATAHRRTWRREARDAIKNFIEAYVKCDIKTCIDRESSRKEGLVTADMYRKALERKVGSKGYEGLGEVVGVDVPFEEGGADIVVESDRMTAGEAADIIFGELKRRGLIK